MKLTTRHRIMLAEMINEHIWYVSIGTKDNPRLQFVSLAQELSQYTDDELDAMIYYLEAWLYIANNAIHSMLKIRITDQQLWELAMSIKTGFADGLAASFNVMNKIAENCPQVDMESVDE